MRVWPRRRWFAVVRAGAAMVVGWRLAAGGRGATPLDAATGGTGAAVPSISVVVPARDEARRIGPLLAAVTGAPGVCEVIVVDDRSSDATAAIAAAAGARVVAGRPRPDGWAGKAWALQQGIEVAGGEWIVTLDADTRPDPRLAAVAVARAVSGDTDLLTVAGRFDCPTGPARWLHASMLTTLVYRFGRPGTSCRGRTRLLANGQCMVFRRVGLLDAGGLAPVAAAMVEDVALARRLAGSGQNVEFLDGTALLTVRMFESFAGTRRGWGRSLGLPGIGPVWRRAADVVVLALAMPVPVGRVVTGRADLLDGVALALRAGTLVGTGRAYTRLGIAYWLSPLADGLSVAALAGGLVRRRRVWRGRVYRI